MAGATVSAEQNALTAGERQKFAQMFREFKGVFTQAARTAIPEDHFYDLTNLIPIGAANLHTVPNIGALLHDFGTHVVYFSQYAQVTTIPYQIEFTADGGIYAYNIGSGAVTHINPSTALSGSGSRMAQWQNTYILIIDSTGYYKWDGTTFALLSGDHQPAAGTDIAVYGGRVWVSNGRLILYSAAYDGTGTTDPTNDSAWLTANGAGFLNMTDPTLTGSITRLWQQNGYLYIFGSTCVYAISDLYVPTGASPPTPVFVLTNVQGIIGTDQPLSVFAYNRLVVFANRFGAWAIDGVNADHISSDIDGTWQYLSFAQSISGGQVIVLSQLCAAFLITRLNDPIFGSGPIIAMWFNGKWWFANFGTETLIATAIINSVPALYAFIGNKMYQLFADNTTAPDTRAMTPLWGMGDQISAKEVIRAGAELTVDLFGGSITLSADGTSSSTQFPAVTEPGTLQFVSNSGALINFVGITPIIWTVSNYQLYSGDSPGVFSNYVGMTMTSHASGFELESFFMDWKKTQRWAR